jgi:hypothetical protein
LNNKLQLQESKQSSIIPKDAPKNQAIKIPDEPEPISAPIEEPIFDQSQCSTDPKEKAYFNEIIGKRKFKTLLRYRASRDGWMKADFHRMSDGKGATVSLFKIKDNDQCVGGFTSAYKWPLPQYGDYVTDSTAMLFNLTTRKLFKCIKHEWAIVCG